MITTSRLTGVVAAVVLSAVAAQAQTPTFSKDVAPIFYKSCVRCHRPGEIGPMPLLTYADARPWVRSIKESVESRQMPPWHADAAHLPFANDRSLSSREIDTIARWADSGAPRILVTAHFDNSPGNKDNPDPTALVRYGDQTWDEMMASYFTYTIESRTGQTS